MTNLNHLLGCVAIIILLQPVLLAQSLERSTVNTAGSSASLSPGTISYSIGETFVGTSTSGSIVLTQGFQQPPFLVDTEPEPELGLEDLTQLIEIYPNPANDFINLRMQNGTLDNLIITVYNINGQVQKVPVIRNTEIQLDIQQLTAGEYFIRLSGNDRYALFKLLKIN